MARHLRREEQESEGRGQRPRGQLSQLWEPGPSAHSQPRHPRPRRRLPAELAWEGRHRSASAPQARPGWTRQDRVPGALDASTRPVCTAAARRQCLGEGGCRLITGGGPSRGLHRSGHPAAPLADRGSFWRRATRRAGDARISGSNWAGRRRGTSAPRGCGGRSSPQLGLSV